MVSLLVITHDHVGRALFDAAVSVLGRCPLACEIMSVSQNCEPQERLEKAEQLLQQLQTASNCPDVLVLTDLYGSTPSNIATRLANEHVRVITGINLPMLVRIMNYPDQPLATLVDKAVNGGQCGVMIFEP